MKQNNKQSSNAKKIVITLDRSTIEKTRLEREDVDFVTDSRASLSATSTPFAGATLYILLLFIFIGLIWANFGKLDEVTRGIGKVVPSSQIQIIQNLEGGILAKIFVHEGDIVKQGQILAQLNTTRFTAQYKESYNKYLALLATAARLKAEVQYQAKITFSQEVLNDSSLVQREIALFKSRLLALKNSLHNLQQKLQLTQHELTIIEPLAKEGIISQIELLRLKRDMVTIKQQTDKQKDSYREQAFTALTKTRAEIAMLSETLSILKDRMHRTTIRSPMPGIVKQIYVNTIGGIIKSAMPIMEIVPLNDKLLIEAKIKPADIAFIKPGQNAIVKITAYDYSIYGGLKAKVITVCADTSVDKIGNSYYEVTLATDKSYLGSKVGSLPIMPGMTASVDILTGKKSVLSYILKPLLRAKEKALREK